MGTALFAHHHSDIGVLGEILGPDSKSQHRLSPERLHRDGLSYVMTSDQPVTLFNHSRKFSYESLLVITQKCPAVQIQNGAPDGC